MPMETGQRTAPDKRTAAFEDIFGRRNSQTRPGGPAPLTPQRYANAMPVANKNPFMNAQPYPKGPGATTSVYSTPPQVVAGSHRVISQPSLSHSFRVPEASWNATHPYPLSATRNIPAESPYQGAVPAHMPGPTSLPDTTEYASGSMARAMEEVYLDSSRRIPQGPVYSKTSRSQSTGASSMTPPSFYDARTDFSRFVASTNSMPNSSTGFPPSSMQNSVHSAQVQRMSLDQASSADDSYISAPSYPQGIPRSEAMHDLRAVHSNLELARAYMKSEGVNSSASSVLMDSTNQKRISSPLSVENNSPRSSIHLNCNESNVSMAKHAFSTFSPSHKRSQREPPLNPALLSEVARAFEAQILPTERFKNELTYTHAFDGREAVQTLMSICKTQDRNLALLVGRALDAQKFFHEVTYDHRLRDSPTALYQFRNRGFGPLAFGVGSPEVMSRKASAGSLSGGRGLQQLSDMDSNPRRATAEPKEDAVSYPTGVFTLLTKCYSPTCSSATPCYSTSCPRHTSPVSQAITQSLSHSDSSEGFVNIDSHLWAETVSQDVYESVPERERKRQEVIFEIIATERQYVQDLEYLRTIWIQPLSTQHIVPPPRREEFVQKVFCNLLDILAVNMRLAEMLTRRQKHHSVVEYIGDIFAEIVQQFEPYVEYGANQASARIRVASERSSNPVFDMFVADTERKVVSRKLELNGYLTKPTTRLARYPLLFEQLLKYTSEDNVDKTVLPRVTQHIQRLLNRVNDATGRSENRIQIGFLSKQLVFKPQDMVDLRLEDENRELVFKSALKKRGMQSDSSEIQVYLFDHALLMVKIKIIHKTEVYRVYRRPIPLELLQVTIYEDGNIHKGQKPRAIHSCSSLGHRTSVGPSPGNPIPKQDAKSGYAITFTYLGKHGYSLTLWASTLSGRDKWFEHAEARQEIVRQQSCIFDLIPVSSMLVDQGSTRIICGVPFNFGRQVFFGKEDGVYLSYMREQNRAPTLVLPLTGVTQIDLLEEYQILLVLAEQVLYTFTLDALDTADPAGSLRQGRRIASHTTFFKAGICMGRTLVCVVKSGSLSSTIKILEPIECSLRMKKQPALRKLRPGAQDALRVFKEFYMPTESSSIHFFKSKLCMGTPKGFEIVDLETLDTQGLLDPADISLDFVQRRENLKPIAIFRVDGEFLLCYNEFAFFVNKNGWRARSDWIVHWEGNPNAFAMHYPYVLAFEPSFIEVRHIETGALHQVIMGYNMRCLFADSLPSRFQGSRAAKSGFSHPMRTVMSNAAHAESLPDSPMNSSSDMSGVASIKTGAILTPRQGTSAWGSPVMGSPIMSPGPMHQSFSSANPHAMVMNTAPTPLAPSPHVPILDSMVQSRGEILFVGDSAPYIIRMHSSFM